MKKIKDLFKRTGTNSRPELDYEYYIHWAVTNRCNYSCGYCVINTYIEQASSAEPLDIRRILKRVKKIPGVILFTFTGGEPFLIPNLPECVVELTKKHFVRIDTNLSIKKTCEKFLEMVDPSRIWEITFSPHVLERRKQKHTLEELCDRVNKFQMKGFKIIGNYVVWPPLIKQFKKDQAFFNQRGIKLFPTLFIGNYRGKQYPEDKGIVTYTQEDLDWIERYNPDALIVLTPSRGQLCPAGSRAFFIDSNYNVYPCTASQKKIGQFYEKWETLKKVVKCPIDRCYCPFNKPFAINANHLQQRYIMQKAVRKLGVYSDEESRRYF
jgi:MoaA/NifB/PqqE/SkfB family radical SAM enzyme